MSYTTLSSGSGTVTIDFGSTPTDEGSVVVTGVNNMSTTSRIILSYQVPAGTVNIQGRRLKLTGVSIASFVQTVVVGGPYVATWKLCFGHTAVSLQTAEAATTKAPRRVNLPFVQLVTAAQAVSTTVAQNVYTYVFDNPIYVNPGEFIALVTQHTGTVGSSGTVAHSIMYDYSWE